MSSYSYNYKNFMLYLEMKSEQVSNILADMGLASISSRKETLEQNKIFPSELEEAKTIFQICILQCLGSLRSRFIMEKDLCNLVYTKDGVSDWLSREINGLKLKYETKDSIFISTLYGEPYERVYAYALLQIYMDIAKDFSLSIKKGESAKIIPIKQRRTSKKKQKAKAS